jgi:hypothetical protein
VQCIFSRKNHGLFSAQVNKTKTMNKFKDSTSSDYANRDTRASHVALYSLRPTIRDVQLGLSYAAIHSRIPPLLAGVSIILPGFEHRPALSYSVFKTQHRSDAQIVLPQVIQYRIQSSRLLDHNSSDIVGLQSLYLERIVTVDNKCLGPRSSYDVRERFLVPRDSISSVAFKENSEDEKFWKCLNVAEKIVTMTNTDTTTLNKRDSVEINQTQPRKLAKRLFCRTGPQENSNRLRIVVNDNQEHSKAKDVTIELDAALRWLKNKVVIPSHNQIYLTRHTICPRDFNERPCQKSQDEQMNLESLLAIIPDLGGIIIPSKIVPSSLPLIDDKSSNGKEVDEEEEEEQRRSWARKQKNSQAVSLPQLLSESFDAFKLGRQPPMLLAPVLRRK